MQKLCPWNKKLQHFPSVTIRCTCRIPYILMEVKRTIHLFQGAYVNKCWSFSHDFLFLTFCTGESGGVPLLCCCCCAASTCFVTDFFDFPKDKRLLNPPPLSSEKYQKITRIKHNDKINWKWIHVNLIFCLVNHHCTKLHLTYQNNS